MAVQSTKYANIPANNTNSHKPCCLQILMKDAMVTGNNTRSASDLSVPVRVFYV
jgi:hypothetical protein